MRQEQGLELLIQDQKQLITVKILSSLLLGGCPRIECLLGNCSCIALPTCIHALVRKSPFGHFPVYYKVGDIARQNFKISVKELFKQGKKLSIGN